MVTEAHYYNTVASSLKFSKVTNTLGLISQYQSNSMQFLFQWKLLRLYFLDQRGNIETVEPERPKIKHKGLNHALNQSDLSDLQPMNQPFESNSIQLKHIGIQMKGKLCYTRAIDRAL